ncbi:M48 family metallopeptidase [Candidatus Kaiserbacteria bacterium]|nr:MAG: M48 family metallopeptidase [Candidatus Kaiserbacteria bacterium]
MNKTLTLDGKDINYQIRRSTRAKHVNLTVHANGAVVVALPHTALESLAEAFIREKAQWLMKRLSYFKKFENTSLAALTRKDYLKNKESARILAHERLEHFNSLYKFSYNSVSIRDQKKCWGSCSNKKNLNFNYKILFISEALRNYVIVHELCHLQELNHSKKFWDLVARTIPNYKECKKELGKIL